MSKFEFDFTEEQVEELLHGNKEVGQWYEAMQEILPYYEINTVNSCLLYTSPSPRDRTRSRMPSSA